MTVILLLIVSSVVVPAGTLGKFERDRRKKDPSDVEVERELYYSEIKSLQHVLQALLLVSMVAYSVALFGRLIGIIVAAIIALEYGAFASVPFVRRFGTKQYARFEKKLLGFVQKYVKYIKYIRIFTPEAPETELHSRQELEHLVETSSHILSSEEKKLIVSGLHFKGMLVKEIMTPRSMIDAINKVELLGPLVLDDLHKKGHSRFPVIENDVDHVVGMLYLRDVLHVDGTKKHTSKVETAMDPRVFYIHADQSLDHAMTAFIKTHHHLFIVVNEYRETVGLLSLEDVTEALLGRDIVDEFDEHEDLRAVAMRNPHRNNQSSGSSDV